MTQHTMNASSAARAHKPDWRLPPQSLGFMLLLAALGALPPFSIDLALPALTQIGISLQAGPDLVLLTLSVFMVGFALAQLVFGPVSDRFGRRPTLLAGLGLFSAGSVACAVAPNIELLLLSRLVEGCGAGAGMVMVFAIVRDLFEGVEARTKLSYVTVVLNVAPTIAPTIGAALLLVGDWRLGYWLLALGGVVLMLSIGFGIQESLPEKDPQALRFSRLFDNYRRIVTHRVAGAYVLVNALAFGGMFAWISGSAFVLMHVHRLSAQQYAVAFGGAALAVLVGSFISGRLSQSHIRMRVPMLVGLSGLFCAAALLLTISLLGALSLAPLYGLVLLASLSFGLVAPNAAHGVMQPMPHMAGVAGAALGFVQMAIGAIAAALVAWLNDGHSAWSMVVTMLLCASLALLIYLWRIVPVESGVTH